jgi:hypothetical protein
VSVLTWNVVSVGEGAVQADGLGMHSPSSMHMSVAGLVRVAEVDPVIAKRWGGECLYILTTRGREWLGRRKGGSAGESGIRGVGGVEGVGVTERVAGVGTASKASGASRTSRVTAASVWGKERVGRVGSKRKRVT